MTQRKHSGRMLHQVVSFPPIPRLPKAPRLPPDSRQTGSARTIEAIAVALRVETNAGSAGSWTGFHASAVDVGRLQATLERGLARFDDAQLEARWDEIFDWIRRIVRSWVQRCKQMRVERRQSGIRVEIQSQDDLGYYEYRFDLFPRRGRQRK